MSSSRTVLYVPTTLTLFSHLRECPIFEKRKMVSVHRRQDLADAPTCRKHFFYGNRVIKQLFLSPRATVIFPPIRAVIIERCCSRVPEVPRHRPVTALFGRQLFTCIRLERLHILIPPGPTLPI